MFPTLALIFSASDPDKRIGLKGIETFSPAGGCRMVAGRGRRGRGGSNSVPQPLKEAFLTGLGKVGPLSGKMFPLSAGYIRGGMGPSANNLLPRSRFRVLMCSVDSGRIGYELLDRVNLYGLAKKVN